MSAQVLPRPRFATPAVRRSGGALAVGVLVLLGVGGCGTFYDEPRCQETVTAVEFDDEVAALGFSASTGLAPAVGARSCQWTWSAPDQSVPGAASHEDVVVNAELLLEYRGGSVEYVGSRRVGQVPPGQPEARLACVGSHLRANLELDIRTDDRGLDGTLAVVLELSSSAGSGDFTVDLLEQDLSGAYEFEWDDDWPYRQRLLVARFGTDGSVAGSLFEQVETVPASGGGNTLVASGVVFRSADFTCTPPAEARSGEP